MRSSPFSLVLVLLLVSGCLSRRVQASAEESGAPPDPTPVTLRFGWPDDLRLKVRHSRQTMLNGGLTDSGEQSYFRRSVTTPSGERQVRLEADPAAPTTEPFALSPLALAPILVIDGTGAVVKVHEVEIPDVHPASAGGAFVVEMGNVNRKATRARMSSLTIDEWDALAEHWRDRTLRPGEELDEVLESSTFIAGADLLLQVRSSFVERAPCAEGDEARSCVKLRIAVELSPESRTAAADAMTRLSIAATGDAAGPQFQYENVRVSESYELVTDPHTLIPRSLHRSRMVKAQALFENGARHLFNQSERNSWHYEVASGR